MFVPNNQVSLNNLCVFYWVRNVLLSQELRKSDFSVINTNNTLMIKAATLVLHLIDYIKVS